MKKLLLASIAVLAHGVLFAAEQTLTLEEVLRAVRARNPAVQAARENWQAMRERVPQAAAWEDPRAEITQVVKRFPSVPANSFTDNQLTLEQALPISGKNRSRARIATAEAGSAAEDYRRAAFDAIHRATAAFYTIVSAHAKLELNTRATVSLKQLAEVTRTKFEVGRRAQSEVLTAEIALARNAEARIDLDRQLSNAESELNALMNRPALTAHGRPASAAFSPPKISSPRQTLALALRHRPEVIGARAKVEAAAAREQAARREWIPDPALRVSAMRYNDSRDGLSEVTAGVAFNLPWLNAGKYSAQIRETQHALESARHELAAAEAETSRLVRDQLQKIEAFVHHYELYRENILPLAQQTAQSTQTAYEADQGTFLEVANAQRDQQAIELDMLNHLLDAQIAAAELRAMVGADQTESSK